jgi:hypothetical protein
LLKYKIGFFRVHPTIFTQNQTEKSGLLAIYLFFMFTPICELSWRIMEFNPAAPPICLNKNIRISNHYWLIKNYDREYVLENLRIDQTLKLIDSTTTWFDSFHLANDLNNKTNGEICVF